MRKIIGIRSLALTCCAVGVLASSGQVWAVDNCTQITAQGETDVDSMPNSATDPDNDAAKTFANILANNPTDGSSDANQTYDDESCAPLTVNIIHDFGDAPESYGTVLTPTDPADPVAAQHEVVPWLKLGTLIDDETDGAPNADANGDDAAGSADEDGVSIPGMTAGQNAPVITLLAPVNNTSADAFAACWIDYDVNGTFDAGEFGSVTVPSGNAANLTITMPNVPAGVPAADAIDSYARCRLSNIELLAGNAAGVLNDNTGIADGEVEDYPVNFTAEDMLDLALLKALAADQDTAVNVGDNITFTITVTNQGTVDATNIIITDYIPEGLTLNDNAWTAGTNAAGEAIATLNNGLAVSQTDGSTTVDITFTVGAGAAGDLTNTAEISIADGGDDVNGEPRVDQDSTPDTVNEDTVKDGVILENGKASTDNDEDDHDIAVIHINQVDLDLSKQVLNAAGAAITSANRGDTVIYELTVTNSGPDTATGIVVNDKLPAGVTYSGNNAVSPASYDAGTGVWTVGSDLADGASATLRITVTID